MDYKTLQRITDQELKWYYQGKMLDDADELGLYDEYLHWLTKHRTIDELGKMSDEFDEAICNAEEAGIGHRVVDAKNNIKQMLR